jgi:hypothetical protein
MRIEVVVDKEGRHFSYEFDCDRIIDGTRSCTTNEGGGKLVIMKESKNKSTTATSTDVIYGTVAVFNIWTFWRIIEKKKLEKKVRTCQHCGKDFETDSEGEERFCPNHRR